MLCEIQRVATFEGLDKFLSTDESTDSDNDSSKKGLAECKVACSPTGEVIVFAKPRELVICKLKWMPSSSDGPKVKYCSYHSNYLVRAEGELITSILCLPFEHEKRTQKTLQNSIDWTCVVVGFSSGCVRFLTEDLIELCCNNLHEEPIKEIKCYCHPEGFQSPGDSNSLYILCKTVIFVLDLIAIKDALKSRRHQLSKGHTFKSDGDSLLHFRKYIFSGQEVVNDACYLGASILPFANCFDQFVLASLEGFSGRIRRPVEFFAITSGKRPFVAFHSSPEEKKGESVVSAVASAVTYAIKSSVTGWFGLNQAEKPKEVVVDPGNPLNCEFGLCDIWRQGQSIILSPDCLYSAVADSLGRVILIDNVTGIAQRMWKGYRDAQCGFIQVEEDTKRDKTTMPLPRQALFLIIYAPKRGLINIFATQTGRRVASFDVTESGRLVYIWYNSPNRDSSKHNSSFTVNRVLFVSEEGIQEFSIPFHCALAEDNITVDRDFHVLKKIKKLLKTETNPDSDNFVEEMEKYVQELKTNEVRFQALKLIYASNNMTVNALKGVLDVFTEEFQNEEPGLKKLVEFAKVIKNLVSLYEFSLNLENSPPKCETKEDEGKEKGDTTSTGSLAKILKISEKELNMILTFMEQIKEIDCIKKPKVGFKESTSRKLGKFLSSFDFESFLNGLRDENENESKEREKTTQSFRYLCLKSNRKGEIYWSVGELMFKGLFRSTSALDEWKSLVKDCLLDPKDLVLCLMSYWCEKPLPNDLYSEAASFVEVLKAVCLLNDLSNVTVEYNSESPWWSLLRSFIAKNPFTIQGLFGALCCRSVTISIEQDGELSAKTSPDKKDGNFGSYPLFFEWETMSKDTCQWDIMITQLQDAALLNAVLSLKFKDENKPGVLAVVPFDFEFQCLSSIQEGGSGRVAELVGRWLLQFGFDPEVLIDLKDVEFHGVENRKEETGQEFVFELDKASEGRSKEENLNLALEYLTLLKHRFPYSLTSSAILGNVSWEYLCHWRKNIAEVDCLEAGFRCLKAIPSKQIKRGIAYLSWRTYLEQKFQNLASMINRIGKVPKDKLCIQEIGLRGEQTPAFLKVVRGYLGVVMEKVESETEFDFKTNRENIWQYNPTRIGRQSLMSIALCQTKIRIIFIQQQFCLSAVVLIVAGLNVKMSKMFYFLFGKAELLNFTSLRDPPAQFSVVTLTESRKYFLRKAIAAAVQTIELIECLPAVPLSEVPESLPAARLKVDEYKNWISLCFELCEFWSINRDILRVHQICELYSCGFDLLAEEVITTIYPSPDLASQLLVLAGKRLKYMFQDSRFEQMKNIYYTSNVYGWIKSLDLENFTYQSKSFEDTKIMMNHVVSWFPENHSEKKLADELLDLIVTLEGLRMCLEED